jgi:predicted aspartyl protease
MRGHIFGWLGLLTVLATAGKPLAAEQTVRFELYRDYLIVARGSAGPLRDLNFVVDTGASPSVLDRRVAQKLHLPESPASIAVIAGNVGAGQSVAPSLELGPLRRDNLPVLIADLSFFQKAFPVRIDGMIGLDLLGQGPFLIDYRSREIRFGSLPNLVNSLPMHLRDGLPIVDAELDHLPAHLLLDTGAASLVLFGPPQPPSPKPMKISVTIGEFDRNKIWLQSLRLGEAEFGREAAFVVRGPTKAHDFDGLMSPASLGINRVGMDLERGVLVFSR